MSDSASICSSARMRATWHAEHKKHVRRCAKRLARHTSALHPNYKVTSSDPKPGRTVVGTAGSPIQNYTKFDMRVVMSFVHLWHSGM